MSSDDVIVEISSAFPDVIKVNRHTLEIGDFVFDPMGGQHKVAKVRRYRAHTTAVREDGEVFVLAHNETMTIRREKS